jgi:hypothetical protein
MTDERWLHLEKTGKGLTEDEMKEGWHWCYEYDLLLMGPGMSGFENCLHSCFEEEARIALSVSNPPVPFTDCQAPTYKEKP